MNAWQIMLRKNNQAPIVFLCFHDNYVPLQIQKILFFFKLSTIEQLIAFE